MRKSVTVLQKKNAREGYARIRGEGHHHDKRSFSIIEQIISKVTKCLNNVIKCLATSRH